MKDIKGKSKFEFVSTTVKIIFYSVSLIALVIMTLFVYSMLALFNLIETNNSKEFFKSYREDRKDWNQVFVKLFKGMA
jgi:hypothetical protein